MGVERWHEAAIEYTDIDAIRKALVGRKIINTLGSGGDYPAEVKFILDDGSILTAHATDGGCACSNGCFNVLPVNVINGTILNAEVREEVETWESSSPEVVEPGSVRHGSSKISVFVYTDLGEQVLLTSEGGDNGYYGWGFWLHVDPPTAA